MIKFGASVLAAAAFLLCGWSASATTIYSLTYDGCTGSCGTGPFGTIALDQTTPTTVTVTVTLAGSERFAGSGAGDSLAFNVPGPVTLGNITPGFDIGPAPDHASTFGTFLESITCVSCKGSHADNLAGPLTFNVSSITGVTVSDFHANANGYFFASDVVGANGNTGNVAAGSAVAPEPASLALLGCGLLAFVFMRKRALFASR